ncbi:Gfo/Idh/MocA family protein [Planctomyces sp. SH-PL14]|jgi:predicted dehydrogenase|uniref:Gfo/Idh/MocA family protein n=1 Tax=Planctomyces sp. SH-PL14 TaxID=1632864 RepID=UPI00078C772D|nr:Gfo/Idh/MocA family oxidoreductase [Planctomyces sp. SH-PL14]AMV22184.1 Putative 4,5-dihydroxyphthalate dehydrogenase [Planctomyces sp. SH-PL14]
MSEVKPSENRSRREFMKTSTGLALSGGLLSSFGAASAVHAAGSDVLKVGLVGCGGRGTGAASQALRADPNVKLVAVADAFDDRLNQCVTILSGQKDLKDKVDVADDHKFVGFDCYQKLIDSGVDVVLLASPPHFRPAQIAAAVEKGIHIFAEKPIAVDVPGSLSVLASCEKAKEKKLNVVSGLCWRYHPAIREAMQRVHAGDIGDVVAMRCSYFTGGLWNHGRKEGWSDVEWQMRNWLYFTWLSGDHLSEQAIHSVDKMAWAVGDKAPIAASATGGRQTRTDAAYGHIYDHFAVEYEYDDGVRGFGRCRQQAGCYPDVSDTIYGTKGLCHIQSDKARIEGEKPWSSDKLGGDMYQLEHNALFAAIRKGEPINNGAYMVNSTLMTILGREAAYTGKRITWEDLLKSETKLGPSEYAWTDLPVAPVAMPGVKA